MCPTDGSGNYSLPAGSDAVTGEVIEAATHNTPLDDIEAGLTARVMRNGSAAMTGNLPMGSNKLTGLAAGTANGNSVRYDEWVVLGTETGPGRIELATSAETNTATSTTLATHPAGVKSGILNLIATATNIWAGTADKLLAPDKVVDAGAFVAITDQATIATDMATGRNFSVTIADNRTMGNPTNVKVGQVITYQITQGTGAPRTITWSANFDFGDAAEPTLSTSEGDIDLIQFFTRTATSIVYMGARLGV